MDKRLKAKIKFLNPTFLSNMELFLSFFVAYLSACDKVVPFAMNGVLIISVFMVMAKALSDALGRRHNEGFSALAFSNNMENVVFVLKFESPGSF